MVFQRDPTTGALTQLAGTAGCITPNGSDQDGAGQCQTDSTLSGPDGISISSDDRFVYVVDYDNSSIHVFAGNTTTGTLSDIQCIAEAPVPTGCTQGRVVGDSEYLALSPDGLYAYGGEYGNGMSIFDRDPTTGLLTQKAGTAGCITDDGDDDTGASTCAVGRDVAGTYPVMVSPNGNTLYDVAAEDHGLSVFHINSDGTLTQFPGTEGCVTDTGMDNTGASTCATGREVGPYGGVLSPDGGSLYLSDNDTGSGGVAIFSLDPSTGVATQMPGLAGCISADGSSDGTAGQCTQGRALSEGYGMGISPDGHSVYQATEDSTDAGLAIYSRETAPVCQGTAAATAVNDPVSVTLNCPDADGDAVTRAITSGPSHGTLSAINNATGAVTYTPAHGFKGTDSFTFNATDGINTATPATATITVAAATLSKLRVSPSKVSVAGRKVKGRCVKPTKKNKKHAKCTRLVSVNGKISRTTAAGARAFTFNGKIGGADLPAGTYKLTATPASGTAKTVTFKITG